MQEVFVQVIDVLYDAILHRAGDAKEIKDGKMLDVLAQADTAGMWANGHTELCGHEDDGKVFVHAGYAAAVDLADIDGTGLQKLLEHDGVVTMLARGYAYGCFTSDAGMAEDVIGTCRLFHPPGRYFRKQVGTSDGFVYAPFLVGVDLM